MSELPLLRVYATMQSYWEAVVERVSECRPIAQCISWWPSAASADQWQISKVLIDLLTILPATVIVKIKYISCCRLVTDFILECTAMILSTIFDANMTSPHHTPRCRLFSTTAPSPSSRLWSTSESKELINSISWKPLWMTLRCGYFSGFVCIIAATFLVHYDVKTFNFNFLMCSLRGVLFV